MAFASRGYLAAIEAAYAHGVDTGLDGLTVDASGSRVFMPSFAAANLGPQRVVNPLPGTVISPAAKAGVDTRPPRLLLRQHPPLDSADGQIENRIDDLAHVQAAWSSSRFGRWNQILDNDPLSVGQVGRVSLRCHEHNANHDLTDGRYSSYSLYGNRPSSSSTKPHNYPALSWQFLNICDR